MGEQAPPVTPTEVERELAAEIVRHGQDGARLVELVAVAVATARAAGHAAGLARGCEFTRQCEIEHPTTLAAMRERVQS